jgi:hypothetical protein
MLRKISLVVGLVILLAFVGAVVYGSFMSQAGDHLMSRRTITATVLGYDRYSRCTPNDPGPELNCPAWDKECEPKDAGWNCLSAARVRPEAKVADSPVKAFVAEWVSELMELFLALALLTFGLSGEKETFPHLKIPTHRRAL